jgi:hypothetical protein
MKEWEKDIEEAIAMKNGYKKYYKFSELSTEMQEYVLKSIQKDSNRANDIEGFERKIMRKDELLKEAVHGVYKENGALIISYWKE